MIPKETVDAMAEIILQGDMDVCICRRSPFDKHDINPPCPKRQWALGKARRVLEAAAPFLRSQALEDAAEYIENWIKAGADDPISPDETRNWLRARAVAERQP